LGGPGGMGICGGRKTISSSISMGIKHLLSKVDCFHSYLLEFRLNF
jgi:hypothetical protein